MPPSDLLGTALVELRTTNDKLFRDLDQVRAKVKADLDKLPEVKLKADGSSAVAEASKVSAALSGLADAEVNISASTTDVDSAVADAQAAMGSVEDETAMLGLDISDVEGGADAAGSLLNGIEGTASLGVDTGDIEGAAAMATSMLDGVAGTASLAVDTSEVDAAVASVQSQLDGISGSLDLSGGGGGFGGGGGAGGGGGVGGSILAGAAGARAGGAGGALAGLGGLAKGAGVAGVVVGVGMAAKGTIDDARESAEALALLDNQIQVTGADSWITAEAIDELASNLQSTTGTSDELIKNTSSWLLTFKSVRNEMGEGNDVFNRAVDASLDLSSIMGGDMQGAATQLGKALQDPVKGVSALGRAGVQFSDDQKAAIKGFVESNDLLSAQKIILGEVEGQVGGAAEAMADPLDRAGVAMGELSEAVGNEILPLLNTLAEAALPIIEGLTDIIPKVGDAVGAIDDRVGDLVEGVRSKWDDVTSWTSETWDSIVGFITGIPERIGDAISGWVQRISDIASLGWEGWGRVTREAVDGFLAFVGSIPEKVGSFLSGLPERLGGIATGAWGWFKDAAGTKVDELLAFVGTIPDRVTSFLSSLPQRLWDIGSSMIRSLIDGVKAMAGAVWDAVTGVVTGPAKFLEGFFKGGAPAAPAPAPPGRASGGPVRAGQSYIVGEGGPELFRPAESGAILNHMDTVRWMVARDLPVGPSSPGPRWMQPPHGYDQGGWLPTGRSDVYNGTGRPELVLAPQQLDAAQRWMTGVAAQPQPQAAPASGGPSYNLTTVNPEPEPASSSYPKMMRRSHMLWGARPEGT